MNLNHQTVQTRGIDTLRSRGNRSREHYAVAMQRIRRMRNLHEVVARDFGAALSGLLRTSVDVRLADVDATDYSRFLCNIGVPTCFHVLDAEPLKERLMLDIEPSILHPMIDRLLGGPVAEEPSPERPLTEIEWRLSERIAGLFLQQCQSAWRGTLDLNLKILQTESDPRPLRILPDDEPVTVVGFELSIGGLQGMMSFCIPSRTIDDLGKLPSENSITDTSAVVEITLAETPIDAGALAGLRIGDIIATETPADSPVLVSIDGTVRFLGKPGTCQGQKAVRLIEAVENPPPDFIPPAT